MEEAFKYVVQVAGAGIAIVPLFATVFVINAALQGLGKFGSFIGGIKGQGLQKRAKDFSDYRRNVRAGNALSGKRTVGGGRFRRQYRRDLRNQAADAALKSGQAQFGVSDTTAKGHVQSMAQSNAQVNAINAANNTRFATGVAAGNPVSQGMNPAVAGDSQVEKAINAQQERAIADAIKDVELSATFAPGDLASIGVELKKAIDGGDGISARAYQNMLLKSGSKGQETYRNTMNSVTPADMADGQKGAAVSELKRNLLQNHAGVKETAADLVKHATTQGATMQQASLDKSTWNLSDEDIVKQKTHSLKEAERASGISQKQARDIQADDQLYRKLDKEGKAIIDRIAI